MSLSRCNNILKIFIQHLVRRKHKVQQRLIGLGFRSLIYLVAVDKVTDVIQIPPEGDMIVQIK